jgi:hypothetical protein
MVFSEIIFNSSLDIISKIILLSNQLIFLDWLIRLSEVST